MAEEDIDALLARTLIGDYDDNEPWEAVRALHGIGSREVLVRASEWCKSDDPRVRARGIDVLAQLGKTADHPSNTFPEECYSIVTDLIKSENDLRPLGSALYALGHLGNPSAVPLIAQYTDHPSADIRYAVAFGLGSFPNDPRALSSLITLTEDPDDEVRNWATFALGTLSDSTDIREALLRRLGDSNEVAREEAIAGLAKRLDQRVLPALMASLTSGPVPATDVVKEAACQLLNMEDAPDDWDAGRYAAALRQRFGC